MGRKLGGNIDRKRINVNLFNDQAGELTTVVPDRELPGIFLLNLQNGLGYRLARSHDFDLERVEPRIWHTRSNANHFPIGDVKI